jgi:D-alanyl-D-alanine carboxypeptidase
MSSRTRAHLVAVGVTAATALALPLALAPERGAGPALTAAPAVGAGWTDDDPTALSRAVLAAAQDAAGTRGGATAQATAQASGVEPAGSAARASAAPAQAGADPAGLDAALQTLVDDGAVAVTARVRTPTVDWSGAAGLRNLHRRQPARDHDRFRVASITKPMIATLVMQEVERGTWTLGTRVEDVLPGLLPGRPEVTVEHLLSHRSGLPTGTLELLADRMSDPLSVDEFFAVMGQDYTEADHVAAALSAPWVDAPGTRFVYSNAGYVVLGMMLEQVTGTDLERLLRDRVFRPAGMPRSDYPDDAQSRGPFLVGATYTGAEGAGWYGMDHFDPDVFGAAGAVTSTTADLVAFTDALLTGRLTSPATVADMTTPRSTEVLEYGLGVYRLPDPCAAPGEPAYLYGHDGAGFGTLSMVLSSPDGSRSLAFGVTGRDYIPTDADVLYDLTDLLVPLLLATC